MMSRSLAPALTVFLLAAAPLAAQTADLVPERRVALTEGQDLPGNDIRSILDTTLPACERACLSDTACVAFTFNTRSLACFPKSAAAEPAPYQGAVSGRVLAAAPGAAARAAERAAEIGFLPQSDLRAARDQAEALARLHVVGGRGLDDLLAAARAERAAGNLLAAARLQGAAVVLGDGADLWAEYARLILASLAPEQDWQNRGRALAAAVNAYLRAGSAGERVSALSVLAEALEANGRGAEMIAPLRLAQSIQPRDEVAAALDSAVAQFGFRIVEHQVESDAARPRICAVFSEDLAAGVDYAPFVQLPEPGLGVEAEGRQLCVEGVEHGRRYALTFRQGLPAASGETTAKPVEIALYVRDRTPAVRFPGRAYVLPRAVASGIPVGTVNATELELKLLRVSDRNLVRAMQNGWFARSLDYWSNESFSTELAEEIWTGTAGVAMEVNRDITTRLPVEEVVAGLPAGIYALQAAIAGQDPYDHPPATQWFVISDLGVTTLWGIDGLHVIVRSLGDASAREGLTVTLVSRANAVIGTAETDAEGRAFFAAGLTAGRGGAAPGLVTVAQRDEDIAFLSLTEPEFDLTDRGVAGREAPPPVDVFLSTDRGAYRAGETVHVTALARDATARAIDGLPLTARLLRPDGVEHSRMLAGAAGAGGHVLSMPLGAAAPRGTWRIEVFADTAAPPLASRPFLVEDFLPERIDFELTLDEGPLRLSDRPVLGVAARYLFGAPGADLAIEGDLRLAAATALEAWPGFRFGRHDEPVPPYGDSLAAGLRTDAAGAAQVPVVWPDIPAPDRPLEARLMLRLSEGSGRPVERSLTRVILPPAPVMGLRPLFEDDTVAEGQEARFQILALGPDAAPLAAEARWTLNRLERRYQWYNLYGQWNWEPATTRTRIAEGTVALAGSGPAEIAVPVDWGSYELVVERGDGPAGAASTEFHAGWYAPADTSSTPDTLEMSLDRPAYRPGETARLRIVSRAEGVALVSVLSNRVIDLKAVPVTAGETLLDLPVTDDWGAGAYVTASVLRPLAAEAGRTPARALGLAHAAVDPGERRLATRLEVLPEAEPRTTLPVALKVEGVAPGQVAYATIAAVDLGILNLTGFAPPDPAGHYFGQHRLGVGIRDLYGRLIDATAGAPGTLRSGGDAGAGLRMQAPPPTEELLAFFSGPLEVAADGHARTELPLPAFNGTVRLMAIAWSPEGVGQASADVLVRDPVVVTATLPRFLAPGDRSRLLLDFVHASGPAGRIGLDVTATGLDLGTVPSGLDLAEGGKAMLAIPLAAPAEAGLHSLRVALTTPDGRLLERELALPVQVNDPEIARQSRFTLAAGQTFTFDAGALAGLVPGTARATLAVGPVARFDAPGLLATLDAYPYGCTEQVTSKALPLLYFDQIAEAMGLGNDAAIRERLAEAIGLVLANQSPNGAFGLWSSGSGDMWLDAYVTDFLSRARAQGLAVPDTAFRNAMDNLRNQVNYAPDFDRGGAEIAYALMVLAREGAAAMGDLRYYADVKGDAFDTPMAAAQLGAALAAYGDQSRADAMFARALRMVEAQAAEAEARLIRADYGTRLRDAAAVLALAGEAGSATAGSEALADAVAAGLAGRRPSTQEALWALMATRALIDRPGARGFTVNGQPVEGPLVRLVDDRGGRGAIAPLAVANGSGEEAVLTLTAFGVPSEPEPAGGNGYAIARSYYDLQGAAVSPGTVAQGTRLVAVIEVTPFAEAEARLIVDDPLPAGFEIDNPNLLRGGDIAALDWLEVVEDIRMAEFRQDRFVAAVDWTSDRSFRLAYILRAVSPGEFHHPAASVEDMYRPEFRARSAAGRVRVTE